MLPSARGGFLLALALAFIPSHAAERWEVQLFHDEDKSSLVLNDIAFPTKARGLAAGALVEHGRLKPLTLVTNDGGAHWTYVKVPETGRSLYCLDESACWMVGESGVWFSGEAGRDWRRVLRERGITRVFFTSRERGFAVGAAKTLLETRNGGKKWTKMPVQADVKSSAERTVFHTISFAGGKVGVITGRSEPLEMRQFPLWMDTSIETRRERPTLSVFLETSDGGEHWSVATASMFGRMTQLVPGRTGRAIALLEFDRFFQYPSEVFRLDAGKTGSIRILRRTDLAVTDIAFLPTGIAFAAGFEPQGKLARLPVPGKLKVLRTDNLADWTEIPVDYRALAHRVSIAAVDPENVWLATDTGMILRLVHR